MYDCELQKEAREEALGGRRLDDVLHTLQIPRGDEPTGLVAVEEGIRNWKRALDGAR